MRKLLSWLDENFLKVGIGFLLIFIPLYPKFPLLDVSHTWVYVRLEDVFVALVVGFWLTRVVRRKSSIRSPLTWPIFVYWLIGGVSLLFSLIFLKAHLANFFPNVAVFHYLRRVEYLSLFFVAFASVDSLKTVRRYFFVLALAVFGVALYGFGQKFLGWPAFLTMNEEFAKGLPLFLGPENRISSTFAGHYDLAAWLVIMIALFGSLIFGLKKRFWQIGAFLTAAVGFFLLLFTASRVSFMAYLLAISLVLFLQKKKWLIIPVVAISFLLMNYVTGTSSRFGKTLRVERVLYDTRTGKPIAALEDESKLGQIITEEEEIASEELPLGTGYIPLRGAPEATQVAVIKKPILTPLKTATKASEIATVSGEFLIRRSLVYDISFTTRFQGTWPRAFEALGRNLFLGSGYSSIDLATDNSYFRALGETGFLGLAAFLGILTSFFLLLKQGLKRISSPFSLSVIIGSGAALAGLMFNAVLIDVFEASKVVLTLWPVIGISVAIIALSLPRRRSLIKEAKAVLDLPAVPLLVLTIVGFSLFTSSFKNYFIGDDFTWFHWAATAKTSDLPRFFLDSAGFFYRPLTKVYFFLIYPFLTMRPSGYHLFDFFLHLGVTLGAYFLVLRLTKNKIVAFLSALIFLIHPLNAEPVLWISSTSILMASFFYLWGFLSYTQWRQNQKGWRVSYYLFTGAAYILALASHELAVTFPLSLAAYDVFNGKDRKWVSKMLPWLPLVILTGIYLWVRFGIARAHGFSGDYNYSLRNLPFNLAGNFFGYFGETLISFRFLDYYDAARAYLRLHKELALVLTLTALWFSVKIFRKLRPGKTVVFLIFWSVILLAPFLGLGNIAERYAYLAKLGFIVLITLFLDRIYQKLRKQKNKLGMSLLAFLVVGSLTFYGRETERAKQEWFRAGEISNEILLALTTNYRQFPLDSHLYFLDLPIRYKRAWVFPVGFEDGLWFIYRDETLVINKVTDLEKTLDLIENKPGHYLFVYENEELKEATR